MHILIYNWKDLKNPDVGGAEIILFELAKRFIKEGHQITWFCRRFKRCIPEEIIDGIKVVRRGNPITVYWHGYRYYRSLSEKPDLVIDALNTIFWQTPLYVKNKKLAYVNQLAREVFFYELPSIISHLAYLLERLQFITYKKASFICYAFSTKEDLVKMGIPRDNIQLFHLGIDHGRYSPGEKSKTPLFLCVSRLVKMKRIDLCIRAMKEVIKNYPETKLAIAGYGYEREKLEKLRDDLDLKNNVFFTDENILFLEKSEKDQKVKLMQEAWALLFPSVKEGWGMTVTECAACGTPAIVTDVTGLRDSVKNNETGLIVSKNPAPKELAEAMIKIIRDRELRENLSQNAIEWAKNFSWDRSFEEFKNIVNRIKNE